MEAEAPVQTSQLPMSRTAESLRQRQRDGLSPRGRYAKPSRISTSVRELEGPVKNEGVILAPAPRSRVAGNRPPAMMRKRQMQDGLHEDNKVKKEAADMKFDITPDGGSAGREGRQFTVANVGNNGRIYLRYELRIMTSTGRFTLSRSG